MAVRQNIILVSALWATSGLSPAQAQSLRAPSTSGTASAAATVPMQTNYQANLERELRESHARGEQPLATATASQAVRVNPFDPVALNNLAVMQAAQGEYQNALVTLERAYRLAPARRDIATNLANLQTWLAQESQFPLSSRSQAQLLFQRIEDVPGDLPGLWSPLPSAAANQAGATGRMSSALSSSAVADTKSQAAGTSRRLEQIRTSREAAPNASGEEREAGSTARRTSSTRR